MPKKSRKQRRIAAIEQSARTVLEVQEGSAETLEQSQLFTFDTTPDALTVGKKRNRKPDYQTGFQMYQREAWAQAASKHEAKRIAAASSTSTRAAARVKRARTQPGIARPTSEDAMPVADLWGTAGPVQPKRTAAKAGKFQVGVALKPADKVHPFTRRTKRRQAGVQDQERTSVPAVPLPHAGSSVNPSAHDHADALGEAVAAELARQQDAARLVESQQLRVPADAAAMVRKGLAEFERREAAALSDDDVLVSDSDDSDARSVCSSMSMSSTASRRLTKAEKARRARHAAAMAEAAARRAAAKQERALANVGVVAHELRKQSKAEEAAREARAARRAEAAAERAANPVRKVGGFAVRDDMLPPEVARTDELATSLRATAVPLAGSMALRDRFINLHKRGKFSLGLPKTKPKAWRKVLKK